ncbi:hypothetical protein [Halobacillus trueperi]|uniref:hypothetical protein n=1 Tax=Halobacillus trueperi TaxID=156205 RepID=UPI0037362B6A
MTKLLTLSISETWKNNYKVVTYDMDACQFHSLQIKESQFRDKDGKIIWDLFGVTKVNQAIPTQSEFSTISGQPVLVKYLDKEEMISFFNNYKTSAKRFFYGNASYGIVKVDSISKIHIPVLKNNKLTQKIDFKSGSKPFTFKLNKDFRWLKYWENVPERKIVEKINQWTTFLNNKNKSVYLILYHHKEYNNPKYNKWIVGFHCL